MIGEIAWYLWYVALIATIAFGLHSVVAWSFRLDDDKEEEEEEECN